MNEIVERALSAVAVELAMAERWEIAARATGIGNRLAEQQGMVARRLTYFVVGTVAYQDVCELDRALDKARTERPVGYTPEQAYFEALAEYVGGTA